MALNTGDAATAAQAITFALDFARGETPVWTTVCINSLSEDIGVQTESWYDFCSEGFSSTVATGFDVSWSGDAVVRKDEPTADLATYAFRYDLSKLNNIPMKITNTLLDETVTVDVSMTSFSMTMVANEIIKISFELKPCAGKPVGAAIV